MIPQSNYYYDSHYDTCTIYIKKAEKFYSTEQNKWIYIIRNEDNNEIIGAEILHYSIMKNSNILKNLPRELMDIIKKLEI